MGEFNLADMLRDVNARDLGQPGREQIEYIPFEKILPDPNNGYSMDGIDDLARNISLVGLRDPLRVYPTENERFIISRRHAALSALIKDGSDMFTAGVPCIVDRADDSPAVREFKLIAANMDNRKLTDADLSQQLERLQDVCRRLEAEGFEIKGRARDWVAELAGVSKTKIGVLQAIRRNLEPSLLAAFDRGQINTSVANELQKLPQDFQERLFCACKNLNMHDVERARKWYESGKRWEPKLSCPDGKTCKRGDTFLRHDIEHPFQACFGNRCCMTCVRGTSKYDPCERRCSKAEAARKDDRDKAKELEAERKEKKLNEVKAETSKSAKRIAKALDAAGIQDDVKIEVAPNWWSNSAFSAGAIRKMAAGVFDAGFDATEDPLRVKRRLDRLPELCETLKCSADYLIERTDELNPGGQAAPVWRSIETDPLPDEGDEAIVVYRMMRSAPTSAKIAVYRDGCFCDREYGMAIAGVLRWQPYHDTENIVPDSGTDTEREKTDND